MRALFALLLLAAACRPRPECEPRARATSTVVTELAFTRVADGSSVVEGFDLDARKSSDTDARGCFRTDFSSPAGEQGIDNQLAVLLPVVDGMTGGALNGAVQSAVNNGQLLLAVTVEDVDDTCDDPNVTVRLQRVFGVPLVGADARLDPWQTFDLLTSEAETVVEATMKDGVVEAGPATLAVPIAVLDAQFTMRLHTGRLRLRYDAEGNLDGLLGGGIDRDELMADVRGFTLPSRIIESLESAMTLFADLDPDEAGACRKLSAAVKLHGRPAFVLR